MVLGFLKLRRPPQKVSELSLAILMMTQGLNDNITIYPQTQNLFRNAVHGSDSYEAAGREIELLFPTITGDVDL